MRKIIFLSVIVLLNYNSLFSQIAINTNGSAPDPSAGLDVNFTNKGLLLPRLTFDQRNAIPNPAEGLVIFCTNCNPDATGAVSVFQSGHWRMFNLNCYNPITPVEGCNIPSYTQIVWKWNPVPIALGYKWNTINDYITATDMATDTSTTETGLVSETTYTRYVWAYNDCGASTPVCLTQSTLCDWVCGNPKVINHVAGNVSAVTKTVTYGTVNNIPGETSKCWITNNLGADQQATSKSDATEASAGWYWQFNRMQGYKHDGTTRTPSTTWITNIDEYLNWDHSNDPCAILLGNSWRIPTVTEWTNVDAAGSWSNWNGPWNSALKMHVAGWLDPSNGSLSFRGSYGGYWSSSMTGNTTYGQAIFFHGSGCGVNMYQKTTGYTIRCIHE